MRRWFGGRGFGRCGGFAGFGVWGDVAWGGRGFGGWFGGGPLFVHGGRFEVPSEGDLEKVKAVLGESSLGVPFVNRWGFQRIPIVHNGVPVGWLFENVDLSSVGVRGVWKVGGFVRAHLVLDGRIVGWVVVNV